MNTTANDRYALRIALAYSAGTSDKFYQLVILPHRGTVVVHYGRQGYGGGQIAWHNDAPPAQKAWRLLRHKLGKGYVVAGVNLVDVNATGGETAAINGTFREVARLWYRDAPTYGHANARFDMTPTARPSKEGIAILNALMGDHPDTDLLYELAFAGDSEEFLRDLAYAHPDCPDEARVARSLLESANQIVTSP